MSARKSTTTRALFLELVLDLAIFSVCAIICLQVFASAHLESVRSAAFSRLGTEAQEIAETFKAGADDVAALASRPASQREGDAVVWYYDQDLAPTSRDEAYFVLTCVVDDSQPVKQARITLREGTEQLFEYEVSSYRLGGGGGS
jgi:Tfp pilus assembly protein PilE